MTNRQHRLDDEATAALDSPGSVGHTFAQEQISPQVLQYRVLRDLGSQNVISLVLYPILWLVLMLHADLRQAYPLFFWTNLLVLVLCTATRYQVHFWMRTLTCQQAQKVERMFVVAVLLNASHWSAMTVWSLIDPELHPIRVAMLLVGTGMIGSGTFAVVFNTTLRIMFPLILSVPAALTLLLSFDPDEQVWGALCLAFLAYILASGRSRQRDYYRAISNSMLLELRTKELEHISFTDAVTGLRSRNYFDAHTEIEWKRAHRLQYPLSLLMIDLDHFKSINDQYGHPVGDRCLAALATQLQKAGRRAGDIVARIGGDEFAILLIAAGEAAGEKAAESLMNEIRGLKVIEGSTQIPISISIGVATVTPTNSRIGDIKDFLASADGALYAAKEGGRNQWIKAAKCSDNALSISATPDSEILPL